MRADISQQQPEHSPPVETEETAPQDEGGDPIAQAILRAAPGRVVPCQDCQGWKVIFREDL